MSRSRRKYKIRGNTTADSEKQSKRKANRKLRRLAKESLKKKDDILPELKEVSNRWNFEKDGKTYDADLPAKFFRK